MYLGLASEEFWSLAPRQYVALSRRRREIMRFETWAAEWGPALITSAMFNLSPLVKKSAKPARPEQFMPSRVAAAKRQDPARKVPGWMALAKAMTKSLGGIIGPTTDRR